MHNIFVYICLLHFLMTLFYFDVFVCVPVSLCAMVHMRGSEDSLPESTAFLTPCGSWRSD